MMQKMTCIVKIHDKSEYRVRNKNEYLLIKSTSLIVDVFKNVFQRRGGKVFLVNVLNVSTIHKYVLHCEWNTFLETQKLTYLRHNTENKSDESFI